MSWQHIAGDETSGFPSRTLPCCANRISLNKYYLDDFIDWLRGIRKCIRQELPERASKSGAPSAAQKGQISGAVE